MMHFNEIAEWLNRFEKEKKEILLDRSVSGWNIWYITKKPIYNYFRNRSIPNNGSEQKKIRLLKRMVDLLDYLTKLFLFAVVKSNSTLFYSYYGYRQIENDHKAINPFIDYFIIKKSISHYTYFESFGSLPKNKKVEVENHFKIEAIKPIIAIIRYFIRKRKDCISASKDFTELINRFDASESIKVEEKLIHHIVCTFIAEYKFYRFILDLLSPQKIMIVDGVPTGILAAAVRKGIPVYEFQHGIIGENKFEYFVDEDFKKCATTIAYPDYIVVFGEYFKKIILKSGFWCDDQILSVGHAAIENLRNKISRRPSNKIERILFITQPSVYANSLHFLKKLQELKLDIEIILKPHPAEKDENISNYKNLLSQLPKAKLLDQKKSLYSALKEVDVVVGFHSTSLLEALSVSLPVVTIATEHFPLGINSYLEEGFLEEIKVVRTAEELAKLINQTSGERLENWKDECGKIGYYFYEKGYFNNIKEIV